MATINGWTNGNSYFAVDFSLLEGILEIDPQIVWESDIFQLLGLFKYWIVE